tara:strand:+ start:4983 stop:5594 length:612 start_codon:yes stop_codon:yes gene_type:complete
MGWGIGNDFNRATQGETPRFAAAAADQMALENAEDARIDAIRSGNIGGVGAIGKAYMDSPEIQSKVKGLFGNASQGANYAEGMGFVPDAGLTSAAEGIGAETASGMGFAPNAALSTGLEGMGAEAIAGGEALTGAGLGLETGAAAGEILAGTEALTGAAAGTEALAGAAAGAEAAAAGSGLLGAASSALPPLAIIMALRGLFG